MSIAPLPVPGVHVAPKYEPSVDPRAALICGGAAGADRRVRSSCDGGARRRPSGVAAPAPLSWVKVAFAINDPTRFDGVRFIGVDERVWRHTEDKYVTVILDLTPIRTAAPPTLGHGPGSLKQSLQSWLASRPDIIGTWESSRGWIHRVQTPRRTPRRKRQSWIAASCTWLATPWMSVADALQNSTTGAGVPPALCKAHRMLHQSRLLTPRQQRQLPNLFSLRHVTRGHLERLGTSGAYRAPGTDVGRP